MYYLNGRPRETREEVLERLFNEHGSALRGFLRARIGSYVDLDDIIQELFLKLAGMEDLDQRVGPQSGSNRAFLLTTANNLMVDMERRNATQYRYTSEYGIEQRDIHSSDAPETIAQAVEELDIVRRAILDMRPKWRRAFVLHRFEHKSYRQIAEEMGVSVKQIEKLISSALTRIRAAVQEQESKD
ncbi:RNA polymerase sigma factor [Porticoccaceae bacterium LTM1]|nr:RNA polymerase sigma factor [Porticoccaceae bacterium LTM1]